MQGYFDIHSHILPGVDDGAADMDETRRMLCAAYEEGIRIIVATPHYTAGSKNLPMDKLKEVFEAVNQVAATVSDDIQLILGNELFYNLGLIEALNNKEALTIDGTRYILVEFLPNATFREIWEGINHCIFAGYIPILAHTERYQCLIKNFKLVYDLINSGTYIQINLSCVAGRALNAKTIFSHRLLKKKLVHFLGTDTHDTKRRAPNVKKAATLIRKKYGEQTVRQLLWDNPMTMIENRHL